MGRKKRGLAPGERLGKRRNRVWDLCQELAKLLRIRKSNLAAVPILGRGDLPGDSNVEIAAFDVWQELPSFALEIRSG